MKKAKQCLAVLSLLLTSGLVACGNNTSATSSAAEDTSVQTFVGVTSSTWDATYTYGDTLYSFELVLNADKTADYNIYTVVQETEAVHSQDTIVLSETKTLFKNSKGSWEEEEGYGYTISVEGLSTYHTDYDSTMGRHGFYFYPEVNGQSNSIVHMESKDPSFAKKVKDSTTYASRNATYTFKAEATGNNSSLAYAYIYLVKDGTVFVDEPKDANRNITIGTSWTEDTATHTIKMNIAGSDYTTSYCDISGKEGYRVVYNSNIYYSAVASGFSWKDYTASDFNGTTIYTFKDEQNGKTIELTNKGIAVIMNRGVMEDSGTYTFENEVFTINLPGHDTFTVAKGEDGKYTFGWEETNNAGTSCESKTTYTFVYDPAE